MLDDSINIVSVFSLSSKKFNIPSQSSVAHTLSCTFQVTLYVLLEDSFGTKGSYRM